MTVLILGATGFIGRHIVRALEAAGHEVVAASRRVGLDRRDIGTIRACIREKRVTAVIDLLAYTEADTLPLLESPCDDVERWVMASSCDVYRNYEGLHRKSSPEPITLLGEDAPLRATRYPYRTDPPRPPAHADAWMDAYDKIPLETALRKRPGHVILRLPMIFGPGDRQRRFRWLLGPMLASHERLTVDPTWAAWRASYGYVEDVADAIATATTHPGCGGRTFNIGGMETPDHRGWIDRFAERLDWRGAVVETPSRGPLAALDLSYPLVLDTRAFRECCAWKEPTPLATALERTIADERDR
ncbi:NAD-dependent epimerase/dehydratase family protein [uncultured Caulobacter sp.]|uniref:NAD-dependent epimerase/dehydratase family protein n=1 Tax=uncultured Caulobacter sp. TaxID=158749 RepID=UPI002636EAE1|nr:NAD-dependent epimerase/dehydratase family protein [uncultured Caulobacter sp.]